MRYGFFIILGFLMSCGGSLSEDQRKQMKEAREQQSIKKVSEAELMEEAFKRGRAIVDLTEVNPLAADSLAETYRFELRWLEPGSSGASEIERQLIEAYLNSMMMGEELKDNVQRLGNDSLLYTKPLVVELPNGVVEVKGTWNVRMAKKHLVLAMDKK
jgi:hypothetical protein